MSGLTQYKPLDSCDTQSQTCCDDNIWSGWGQGCKECSGLSIEDCPISNCPAIRTRTCDTLNGEWLDWGECIPDKARWECEPGQKKSCSNGRGIRECGGWCGWYMCECLPGYENLDDDTCVKTEKISLDIPCPISMSGYRCNAVSCGGRIAIRSRTTDEVVDSGSWYDSTQDGYGSFFSESIYYQSGWAIDIYLTENFAYCEMDYHTQKFELSDFQDGFSLSEYHIKPGGWIMVSSPW